MTIDLNKLRAPFPPDRVSWRVGSTTQDKKRGMALAYIDARDVMERLDEVCGQAGWQCSYPHANGKTVCAIGIKVGDEWIWKADGAGDTDFEAEKGALSDSFKRSAVRWGIGRYLYDVAAPWVEIEPAGKSFRIKESELTKLQNSLGRASPAKSPQSTTEEGAPSPKLLPPEEACKAASKLIEDVNGCISLDEIDGYLKSDKFKSLYGRLPERNRGPVRSACKMRGAKIRAQLGQTQGEEAA